MVWLYIGNRSNPETQTKDGLEMTMASNYFGHFLLTHLLINKLQQSGPARIISVSSLMHIFTDDNFSAGNLNFDKTPNAAARQGYNYSKLAQILFTRHLAKLLRGTGRRNCLFWFAQKGLILLKSIIVPRMAFNFMKLFFDFWKIKGMGVFPEKIYSLFLVSSQFELKYWLADF